MSRARPFLQLQVARELAVRRLRTVTMGEESASSLQPDYYPRYIKDSVDSGRQVRGN